MFNIFSGRQIRFATRSPKWQSVRKDHLKKQSECQACGKKKDLEVHHIIPVHISPEKELDPSNLITLCSEQCHIMFGHFMDFKSWNINVSEDCNYMRSRINNRPYKLE